MAEHCGANQSHLLRHRLSEAQLVQKRPLELRPSSHPVATGTGSWTARLGSAPAHFHLPWSQRPTRWRSRRSRSRYSTRSFMCGRDLLVPEPGASSRVAQPAPCGKDELLARAAVTQRPLQLAVGFGVIHQAFQFAPAHRPLPRVCSDHDNGGRLATGSRKAHIRTRTADLWWVCAGAPKGSGA